MELGFGLIDNNAGILSQSKRYASDNSQRNPKAPPFCLSNYSYPAALIRLDWFDLFDNWFTTVTFYFLLVFLALSVELVDKAVYRRIHIFLDIVGM